MEVHDAGAVREATDLLAAAVAALDLGSMLPATHRELVALGERIERTGRTVKSMAAARVAESAVWKADRDRSAEDWLARTTGTTRAEAARELQTGRDLQAATHPSPPKKTSAKPSPKPPKPPAEPAKAPSPDPEPARPEPAPATPATDS